MTGEELDCEQETSEPVPESSGEASDTNSDADSAGLVAGPLRMGIAGLLAGLIAWQVIHWTFPFFPEPIVQQENPEAPTDRDQERMGIVRDATNRKNAAAAGVLLGALAALLFAAVEGFSQGRIQRTLAITVATILLAACLGGIGGYCSMKFQREYWFHPSFTPMTRELCLQGILWLAIATGIGVGMGIYARRTSLLLGTLLQTILGAVLFVIIYVPLAGVLFPTDYAESTVPESSANIAVWAALALGLMGLMLGMARGASKKPATPSP